jgi:hypothetical protein
VRFKILACLCGCLLAILTLQVSCTADTLYKGKTPQKIGHGERRGKKIIWKTCSDQYDRDYDDPPYSLDHSDNCSVGPPTFGLECQEEKCKVVDEQKTQKFIPDAKNGDDVSLRIEQHLVTLIHKGATVTIEW